MNRMIDLCSVRSSPTLPRLNPLSNHFVFPFESCYQVPLFTMSFGTCKFLAFRRNLPAFPRFSYSESDWFALSLSFAMIG